MSMPQNSRDRCERKKNTQSPSVISGEFSDYWNSDLNLHKPRTSVRYEADQKHMEIEGIINLGSELHSVKVFPLTLYSHW